MTVSTRRRRESACWAALGAQLAGPPLAPLWCPALESRTSGAGRLRRPCSTMGMAKQRVSRASAGLFGHCGWQCVGWPPQPLRRPSSRGVSGAALFLALPPLTSARVRTPSPACRRSGGTEAATSMAAAMSSACAASRPRPWCPRTRPSSASLCATWSTPRPSAICRRPAPSPVREAVGGVQGQPLHIASIPAAAAVAWGQHSARAPRVSGGRRMLAWNGKRSRQAACSWQRIARDVRAAWMGQHQAVIWLGSPLRDCVSLASCLRSAPLAQPAASPENSAAAVGWGRCQAPMLIAPARPPSFQTTRCPRSTARSTTASPPPSTPRSCACARSRTAATASRPSAPSATAPSASDAARRQQQQQRLGGCDEPAASQARCGAQPAGPLARLDLPLSCWRPVALCNTP